MICPARCQHGHHRIRQRDRLPGGSAVLLPILHCQKQGVRRMQCDESWFLRLAAGGLGTHPDDLAGGEQAVEHRRTIVAHPCRQYGRFPYRGRQGDAFQLLNDTHHPVFAVISFAAHRPDTLQPDKECLVFAQSDGLGLGSGLGQRPGPDTSEHLLVQPCLPSVLGGDAVKDLSSCFEHVQGVHRAGRVDRQIRHHPFDGERPMRLGVSCDPAIDVIVRQLVPERPAPQLLLDLMHGPRIHDRREIGLPQQPFQHIGIDRQQLRRSFRLRHVVLVHDGAHIAEQQVLGEWGRNVGRHIDQTDVSRLNVRHDATQRGHVVIVLQAFAGGFQQQREIAFQPRGVQQLRGTQSLLP